MLAEALPAVDALVPEAMAADTSGPFGANPDSAGESAILVTVRVRPFSPKEMTLMAPPTPGRHTIGSNVGLGTMGSKALRKVVHVIDDRILVFDPPEEASSSRFAPTAPPAQTNKRHKDVRFAFDRVFNDDATQQEVYLGTTQPLIDAVLNGFNSTVFAYGATGCGKTHTISGTPTDPGIIFLTMKELFAKIHQSEHERVVEASLSYLEVYNETIRDLLAPPGATATSLALREDARRGVVVAGLSEHVPATVDDVMELVLQGNKNRTQSPTEANATSSRSHAVLQIHIRQKNRAGGLATDVLTATLSLIDLAGSERASVSRNRGDRLLEGANINRSLLALANCINALCDERKKRHIPYRDSKLTRLLKFSLGGNCRTVMIVCCSPASTYFEETYNTLKYANRAKNIKTKVERNSESVKAHVSQYVKQIKEQAEEIKRLRAENTALRAQPGGRGRSAAVAVEPARPTATLQLAEDIRNALSAAFDTVRSSEWEHASTAVVADACAQHLEILAAARAALAGDNTDGTVVTDLRRALEAATEQIAGHRGQVGRHLDHTTLLLTRYRRDTKRADYPAHPTAGRALTSDQKYRLDLERRALELTCANTRLGRAFELSQTLLAGLGRQLGTALAGGTRLLDGLSELIDAGEADAVNTLRTLYHAALPDFQTIATGLATIVTDATAAGPAKWQVAPPSPSRAVSRLLAVVPSVVPSSSSSGRTSPRRGPAPRPRAGTTSRESLGLTARKPSVRPGRSASSSAGFPVPVPPSGSVVKRPRGVLSAQPSLENLKPAKRPNVTGPSSLPPLPPPPPMEVVKSSPSTRRRPWGVTPLADGSPGASDRSTTPPDGDSGAEQSPRHEPPPLDALPARSILKGQRPVPSYTRPTAASKSHSQPPTASATANRIRSGGPVRSATARRRSRNMFDPMGSKPIAADAPTRNRMSARQFLEAAKQQGAADPGPARPAQSALGFRSVQNGPSN
ncbi:tubulin-dependent ATPase kip3 [Tieghemiomyces parasiticus]|uniref:Kinesin-like protein n=1 Tax=Tieghemiomyces parasiticus TaxID=78921 RepID=A0A9W8AAE1_9FUNG|nr:tubulin-dependent ATPase kip3 [Tieghemiomyces parasiticus]